MFQKKNFFFEAYVPFQSESQSRYLKKRRKKNQNNFKKTISFKRKDTFETYQYIEKIEANT
jgi:hypothetical protein